jgi:hypothetical protein
MTPVRPAGRRCHGRAPAAQVLRLPPQQNLPAAARQGGKAAGLLATRALRSAGRAAGTARPALWRWRRCGGRPLPQCERRVARKPAAVAGRTACAGRAAARRLGCGPWRRPAICVGPPAPRWRGSLRSTTPRPSTPPLRPRPPRTGRPPGRPRPAAAAAAVTCACAAAVASMLAVGPAPARLRRKMRHGCARRWLLLARVCKVFLFFDTAVVAGRSSWRRRARAGTRRARQWPKAAGRRCACTTAG